MIATGARLLFWQSGRGSGPEIPCCVPPYCSNRPRKAPACLRLGALQLPSASSWGWHARQGPIFALLEASGNCTIGHCLGQVGACSSVLGSVALKGPAWVAQVRAAPISPGCQEQQRNGTCVLREEEWVSNRGPRPDSLKCGGSRPMTRDFLRLLARCLH